MDEDFEYFLETFGPPVERAVVPEATLRKCSGHLPDQLLIYWREVGWCGFAKGLFWLVDPAVWDAPMELMLDGTGFLEQDAYHVIARNAFGDLWLWGEKTGGSLSILSSDGMVFPSAPRPTFGQKGMDFEMRLFFLRELHEVDLLDNDTKPLFARAYKKLGPLKANEVYGFVPLPALGGSGSLKELQKLDAATYMDLVAHNTPMRVMPDYAAEATRQGLM